jgi:hypothetical protein
MAKIRPIHGEMSGSIAGNTFSRNRYGSYVRQRVKPKQPHSGSQCAARSLVTAVSKAWGSTLTDAQRALWGSFGATHPIKDGLGETRVLTGEAIYVQLNCVILAAGGSRIDTPPAEFKAQNFAQAPIVTMAAGTPACSLAFVLTDSTILTDTKLRIYCTGPLAAGRSFVRPYQKLLEYSGAAPTSPLNLLTVYEAAYGVPVAGQKVWFAAKPVRTTNGAQGQLVTVLCTVAA